MIGKVDHRKVKKITTFLINKQYSSDSKMIANHFNEHCNVCSDAKQIYYKYS